MRLGHVFDLSQTDGEPLPDLTAEPLTGPAPAAMWAALAEQVGAHGYRLERGQCWGANGLHPVAAYQRGAGAAAADLDVRLVPGCGTPPRAAAPVHLMRLVHGGRPGQRVPGGW